MFSKLQLYPHFGLAVSMGGLYSTDQLGCVFTEGSFTTGRLENDSVIHQLASLTTNEMLHSCEKNEDILEKNPKVTMLCVKNKMFDQLYFNGGGEHKVPCSFSLSMHRGAQE